MTKVIKQNKILYYINGYGNMLIPSLTDYRQKIKFLEKQLCSETLSLCEKRISYYCLSHITEKETNLPRIKSLFPPKNPKAYYFDTYEYAQFFNKNTPISYVFGDVIHVPKIPSIVKTRPINSHNQNSVLLKLDKSRHFVWIKNDIPFLEKRNLLIGWGGTAQKHRYRFFEKYFEHPLCNLGQVHKEGGNPKWIKPKISLKEHLKYKFILSLQGNDVASNLKWIMSSNSIAVMPKPTIESWFMEGTLKGGVHYIEIKDDYSDLEEQLSYYIKNPDECLKIIRNANEYSAIFQNENSEDYCSIRVLEKFFNF